MTSGEKTSLAFFLDTASGFLSGGYAPKRDYDFSDDPPPAAGFSSLPLAYQVDEEEATGAETLDDIAEAIRRCDACALCRERKLAVPGEGASDPLVMVVGEGPGEAEDKSGRPFVGPAGQYLDRMLGSINLSRDKNCFIANTVKCHPPGNRDPLPEESGACAHFLEAQIRALRPKVIFCVGRIAAQHLLESSEGIGKLRGRFFEMEKFGGIPLLATYHPSALLRDETFKRPVWEDLKLLKARLSL
ncbi:uracil-DNA glycosylase [Spirochaetia bacterium]|nr:uracil-DNA glycosylase [Spirochaetia bacterium]